jgi:phosphate starvation-inducible PhoH-like protein
MGENSKLIITGDPKQSDLGINDLIDVVRRLEPVAGVGVVYFNEECIVRHPLVGEVIKRLEK